MTKSNPPPVFGLIMAAAVALTLFPQLCTAARSRSTRTMDCGTTVCGNLNITYPIRLKSQPKGCSDLLLEVDYDAQNRTIFVSNNVKFYVQHIFYQSSTLKVSFASLGDDNCSLPLQRFKDDFDYCKQYLRGWHFHSYDSMYLLNCSASVKSPLYVDASRCNNISSSSSSSSSSYFYFLDDSTQVSQFDRACKVINKVPITLSADNITGMSSLEIYDKLLMGIEVSWNYGWGDDVEKVCSDHSLFRAR